MSRGGAREGAGRPKSDKTRLVVHVTESERKAMLKALRIQRGIDVKEQEQEGIDE